MAKTKQDKQMIKLLSKEMDMPIVVVSERTTFKLDNHAIASLKEISDFFDISQRATLDKVIDTFFEYAKNNSEIKKILHDSCSSSLPFESATRKTYVIGKFQLLKLEDLSGNLKVDRDTMLAVIIDAYKLSLEDRMKSDKEYLHSAYNKFNKISGIIDSLTEDEIRVWSHFDSDFMSILRELSEFHLTSIVETEFDEFLDRYTGAKGAR